MKCPACWAEKAFVRQVDGWKGAVLRCLLVVPMKCHHCYHDFYIPWIMTIGKQITPPDRGSHSRRPHRRPHLAGQEAILPLEANRTEHTSSGHDDRRADAA